MREVVLCADGMSLSHPDLLGLSGENLAGQEWLKPISRAEEARSYLRDRAAVQEVWVASSDEMDPINLAAALKRDTDSRAVFLVAAQANGSLRSRANSAGIDGVIDAGEFARRYALRKQGRDRRDASPSTPNRGAEAVGAAPASSQRQLQPQPKSDEASGHPVSGAAAAVAVEKARGGKSPQPSSEAARTSVDGASRHTAPAPRSTAGRSRNAYILTVVSASGGTGKSTVSVVSALIAQSLGCRTLLLDGDLQFGDAAQLLSVKNPLRIDQVLRDPESYERLSPAAGKPAVLAAPLGVEDAEEFSGSLTGMIGELRRRFDVIVINTGAFWTEEHIKLLELSSNTLFLLDQRPGCLGATKRALGLCARCGVASTPFLYAVNRCSKNGMLTSLDISCALSGAKVAELKDGGREVGELMGAGLAEELMQTKNALVQSLQAFLAETLPASLQTRQAPSRDSGQGRRKGKVSFHRKRRA